MGKKASDNVLDAACNHVKNNATNLILLDAEPADRAAALAGALVNIAVTGTDFTVANGDVSGRKVTVGAKSGTASASGNHNHTAIISASDLLAVTTATATKAINSGDTVNSAAFDFEFGDPT